MSNSNISIPNFDHPEDRYSGVRSLWLKVIIRAMFDWVVYKDSKRLQDKKKAESAYKWLFMRDDTPLSFESICTSLDIDPDRIRTRTKAMSRSDVAKIEHLERSSKNKPKEIED